MGDDRIDRLRAGRLGLGKFVWVVCPIVSVLDRTLGTPVLLEILGRDTSPLFAPIPLRTGIFIVLASSFEGPIDVPSISRSFLHLEHRLGAGRGSGEVGGDKAS